MTTFDPRRSTPSLGMPVWLLVILAALGAPRVVLHDLGIATQGPLVALLAIGPPVIWIAAALITRCPRPFLTLLAIGVIYGCFLAIGHQVFWAEAFDEAPRLGDNAEGRLSPGAEEAVMRVATTISSVFTGAAVGLVSAVVALVVSATQARLTRR